MHEMTSLRMKHKINTHHQGYSYLSVFVKADINVKCIFQNKYLVHALDGKTPNHLECTKPYVQDNALRLIARLVKDLSGFPHYIIA